jgi:DNA-binding transcriptional regulator YiaG
MRDRDDKLYAEDEAAEEDVIALQAIAAMLEVDGDNELAWAQREALAAVGNEALVLKARREERERREAAERRARRRARRREEERRAAREEVARVEAARRERAAQEAAEARTRAERQERARRQEEARREVPRRRRAENRRRVAPVRPSPAAPTPPVDRSAPPVVGEQSPVTGARSQPRQRDSEPPAASKEPDRVLQNEQPPLTEADLADWRSRLGLTQQAAADRLGVRQGTISKAESRRDKALGPALQATLVAVLAEGP